MCGSEFCQQPLAAGPLPCPCVTLSLFPNIQGKFAWTKSPLALPLSLLKPLKFLLHFLSSFLPFTPVPGWILRAILDTV